MEIPTSERTPLVIADEINAITQESRRMLLKNAIEVGRRLKEAKEMLKHGEWMNWLKESVNYSKSTAENLINLYKEYGPKLLFSANDDPNSQTFGNLTYSQALMLLGLPEKEREEFVAQNNVPNMSARQLNQAVKEQSGTTDGKAQELTAVKAQSLPEEKALPYTGVKAPIQAEPQTQLLQQNSDDIKIEYIHKPPKPRRVSHQEAAPSPASSLILNYEEKCTACCQTMADAFQELLTALGQLSRLDPQVKEKCSEGASQLASYMVERLKEWPPIAQTNMKGIETYSTYEW